MYPQLKLENQVCFRLYTVSRLLTQAYQPLLQPLGLTYPQYLVMMVLWEKDKQTVGEISGRLQLDTNTITPLLQRMEKQGIIERCRGVVDSRQTVICLTNNGRHLEELAKEVPECITKSWQDPDSAPMDMNQVQQFVSNIDSLIVALKKMTGKSK